MFLSPFFAPPLIIQDDDLQESRENLIKLFSLRPLTRCFSTTDLPPSLTQNGPGKNAFEKEKKRSPSFINFIKRLSLISIGALCRLLQPF